MRISLAKAEAHLHELRQLYTGALTRLGLLAGALDLGGDEPGEKLAAAARRLKTSHRELLEAADCVCTCAAPSGTGHWYVLNNELTTLQAAVDRAQVLTRVEPQATKP